MSSCTILVMIVKKLSTKECMAYFTHALEIENKGIELSDIPIAREFPEWLPGLPPEREVEVSLDIIFGTALIAQSPYIITPTKLIKLKIQLE